MKALLAATGTGIARATYSAGMWKVAHLMSGCEIRCLAADPLAPGIVYAGSQGQGVLRSGDGGMSWRPAGLAGYVLKSLAVSAVQPGTVYAGTKPPLIFVSHDHGQSWEELAGFRRILAPVLVLAGRVALHGLRPGDRPVTRRRGRHACRR